MRAIRMLTCGSPLTDSSLSKPYVVKQEGIMSVNEKLDYQGQPKRLTPLPQTK